VRARAHERTKAARPCLEHGRAQRGYAQTAAATAITQGDFCYIASTMLAAGLTLVPAMLSVLGRPAFWPGKVRQRTEAECAAAADRGLWGRIAAAVTKRPAITLAGSLVLLIVFALGNLGVVENYNFLTGLRGSTESAAGSRRTARACAPR
jgi:uncharacterized membrane protein YdfJ with MMPL/SSD domain